MAALVVGFLLAGGSLVASIASSDSDKARILSPLSDPTNGNVLGEIDRITPTSTPAPTPTPTQTPTPTKKPTPTPSPTPRPTPIIVTSAELEGLFTKYSSEYSVDKELLKRIAYCESSFNPNASNRDYGGLFQFSTLLWVSTRTLMGQDSNVSLRFNPEEAVRTAAFMVSQGRLGIWPNCNT